MGRGPTLAVAIGVFATVFGVPAAAAQSQIPAQPQAQVQTQAPAQTQAQARAAAQVSGHAPDCVGPEVLLVHDLAGTPDDWNFLAADLRAAGWCPVVHSWGTSRPGDLQLPVGGLTGVDAAAAELVRARGWGDPGVASGDTTLRDPIPVVAKGVGGLVVQRALQLSAPGTPPVSAFVTLGPLWNGTNLLGIADIEDISRALGTFDAVLAWERTWMDPLCEGCREAVRGSELLTTMHRDGIRTPGVAYTDIATVTDLLVHPPLEQSPRGTELVVLPSPAGALPVWHGELGRDAGSRTLVLAALDAK